MIINPVLRVVRALFLWSLGLVVLSLPAMAAKPRHHMAPFLITGPQATPAGTSSDGTAGAQYGLFTCQVIGFSPATTCYDPYQMRAAYQVDSMIGAGYNGAGHTIVIVDSFQSPNIVQQLNFYNTFYGLPSLNGLGGPPNPLLGTFTQVAPDGLTPFVVGNADMTGWAEEISLDVLWAHAIAPGANIVLVLAKSDFDTDIQSAVQYAIDHNLGDVISMSFGENESCMDPAILAQQHDAFASATQKGITLFASAGDDGSAQLSCDGSALVQAVSSPASDPLVTGVGGTELHAARYCLASVGCNPAANPAFGTWQGEVVWNEDAIGNGATGGGYSVVYEEPPFQKGTAGLHGGKQRAVPDVGYNAAVRHGVLTYLNIPGIPAGMYLFGGTSAGSPQWAAITTIANQKAGGRLGFLNSAIYQIGKVNKAAAASLHDITVGDNAAEGVDGFDAGPGWDATTGVGTPMDVSLVDNLIKYVSPGDGKSAVATTKPKPHQKPIVPGHAEPH